MQSKHLLLFFATLLCVIVPPARSSDSDICANCDQAKFCSAASVVNSCYSSYQKCSSSPINDCQFNVWRFFCAQCPDDCFYQITCVLNFPTEIKWTDSAKGYWFGRSCTIFTDGNSTSCRNVMAATGASQLTTTSTGEVRFASRGGSGGGGSGSGSGSGSSGSGSTEVTLSPAVIGVVVGAGVVALVVTYKMYNGWGKGTPKETQPEKDDEPQRIPASAYPSIPKPLSRQFDNMSVGGTSVSSSQPTSMSRSVVSHHPQPSHHHYPPQYSPYSPPGAPSHPAAGMSHAFHSNNRIEEIHRLNNQYVTVTAPAPGGMKRSMSSGSLGPQSRTSINQLPPPYPHHMIAGAPMAAAYSSAHPISSPGHPGHPGRPPHPSASMYASHHGSSAASQYNPQPQPHHQHPNQQPMRQSYASLGGLPPHTVPHMSTMTNMYKSNSSMHSTPNMANRSMSQMYATNNSMPSQQHNMARSSVGSQYTRPVPP